MNDATREQPAATPRTAAASATETPPTANETGTAQLAAQELGAQRSEGAHATAAQRQELASLIEWRVAGETVPGASHLRAGIPNQDALLQLRASSVRAPVILSVSDGHGSNKCFRSHRGSRFAVHLAAALLNETLNLARGVEDVKKFAEETRRRLPAELVKRWRDAVEADLRQEPLQESEFARLVEKDGARSRALVEANPFLAYGATLLVVALTPSFALYLQLGDGEILNVSDAGTVTQPLPEDARLLANETTSLCLENAAADFRFVVLPHSDPPPALILLTTDGYANSFSDAAGFHKVGSDLLEMMRSDGFDAINRSIKGWLEEATTAGSGDDCTLAFIVRADALAASPSSTSAAPSNVEATPVAAPVNPHEQPAPAKTA